MSITQAKLIEEFFDLKLKRFLLASQIANEDLNPSEIMQRMIPVEARLEEIRQELRVL